LHRSIIVRRDFIDRLVHEGRHWIARLRDGTIERVAKSHAVETLEMTHWPTKGPDSSKVAQLAEGPEHR
jgi:acylphosphatase